MTLLSAIKEFPSGTLIDYAGTVEPNGWFLCDGRAISRTTYAGLFASISTAYGVGDGSTTFNIPDFRGRFARYNDNMGTAAGAASRDTGRVHGSAQGQATAKNGLTASASSSGVSGTASAGVNLAHSHPASFNIRINSSGLGNQTPTTDNGTGTVNSNNVTVTNSASLDHSHSLSGTAAAQTITVGAGDAETRPINISCNKLIKV